MLVAGSIAATFAFGATALIAKGLRKRPLAVLVQVIGANGVNSVRVEQELSKLVAKRLNDAGYEVTDVVTYAEAVKSGQNAMPKHNWGDRMFTVTVEATKIDAIVPYVETRSYVSEIYETPPSILRTRWEAPITVDVCSSRTLSDSLDVQIKSSVEQYLDYRRKGE